ncbi:hypothetical protein H9645_03175 [Luteimonas sp. Sa2BVA3]|uniref:Meckel syndrome type 1 protein n=1 Tax=Luteimonas colneyensis TaxID=2762230 RepID=A0ABR8UGZ7_9GAMM|nr:hypothetical protein [Luteimonas colneyensis]MBD7987028.1 hypothetical protein [Luteimonas colneyensis]
MTGPTRPDPLTPAERQLADALARGAPPPGPPSALDEAILASARAAAGARAAGAGASAAVAGTAHAITKAGRHRRRHGGPAWLRGGALAATLVIAVGVAWQLRPRFDAPALSGDGTAATAVTAPAASRQVAAEAVVSPPPADAAAKARPDPDPRATPQPVEPLRPAAAPAAAAPAAAAATGSTPPSADGPGTQEPEAPPVVFDAPSPMDTPAPAPAPATAPAPLPLPPPPPAPPAPPAPRALQGPLPAIPDAARAEDAARARAAAEARRRQTNAIDTTAAAADEAGDEDWLDQPLDDTPPASVDSPAVREAWLARIRELVAAERYAEARDSYAEFRRRHPDAPVPADLRMLLGEE